MFFFGGTKNEKKVIKSNFKEAVLMENCTKMFSLKYIEELLISIIKKYILYFWPLL